MSKLRQILKMYSQSYSKQYISDTTGVARNTVKSHLRTFQSTGKSFKELFALSDRLVCLRAGDGLGHSSDRSVLYPFLDLHSFLAGFGSLLTAQIGFRGRHAWVDYRFRAAVGGEFYVSTRWGS